jgi:nucleoside-specific outer membrane channel protein Tsx
LGFCGVNFDINGVIKMKKYTFKGILLALGLVLATLSMQVGARDAGTDTDARADALWQTQLALTNAASTTAKDANIKVRIKFLLL